MPKQNSRLISFVWTALLCAAFLRVLWVLVSFLVLESQLRVSGDAHTFFMVGQGMLNGQELYSGLYEMKPPGIFILSALSLLISGNEIPLLILKLLILVCIPILTAWVAAKIIKSASALDRFHLILATLIFTGAISIYILDRVAGLQSEVFGILFALLYVLIVGWNLRFLSTKRMIFAAIAIAGAVGMREQFLFPLLSAGILMSKDLKFFVRAFAIPCVVALVVGVVYMLMIGELGFYFSVYLPDAFTSEISANELGGLLVRGLHGWILLLDISYLFLMPVFGVIIGILWMTIPVLKVHVSRGIAVLALLCTGSGIVFLNTFFVAFLLSNAALHHTIAHHALLVESISVLSGLLFAGSFIALFKKHRPLVPHVLVTIVATYPLVLAVGAKNFSVYQLTVAVSVYVAVFIVFLHAYEEERIKFPMPLLKNLVMALLIMMTFAAPKIDWGSREAKVEAANAHFVVLRDNAQPFDAMMDRCDFQYYFPWGVAMAWTTHSPIQMRWAMYRSLEPNINSYFRERSKEHLKTVPVVVYGAHAKYDDAEMLDILHTNFTVQPPACAQGYTGPDDVTIYYRKR